MIAAEWLCNTTPVQPPYWIFCLAWPCVWTELSPVIRLDLKQISASCAQAIMPSSEWTNSRGTMAWCILPTIALLCVPCCSGNLRAPVSYNLTEERAYGTFVGNVIADGGLRDKYDSSTLEHLHFSLLEHEDVAVKGLFVIEETTGVIRVAQRVDRDVLCPSAETCVLSLDVQVMPLDYFEIIKVSINILDINDHVPTFPADTIIRRLSEASVVGTALTVPLPSDPDSPKFGVHHYKLISSSDTFELQVPEDPESSEDIYLVLLQPLDRERQDAYMVQLVAFDRGEPPQWGSVMVNISIIDVNDNIPTFLKESYEASLPENSPVGSVILRVIAEDPDTGEQGKVVYLFSKKTLNAYKDTFRINETTGEITAIGTLDYEEKNLYKLTVIARDNSTQALSSQTLVTIHVTDRNDHPPQIKINPQNASNLLISENYTPGDFVAHISVVDLDDGDNGRFNCTLNSKYFALQKLYETEFKLITTSGLDRELHDTFLLPVVCTDKGSPPLQSKLNLLIRIADENDNSPTFGSELVELNVTEGLPSGTILSKITATDADVGDNGEITYLLTDDTNGVFHIDPRTGELISKVVLDHERMSQVNVTVIARDGGIPQHATNITVLINIIDVDDEPLKFVQRYYVFSIAENADKDSYVGTITATDVDTENIIIEYSFIRGQNMSAYPFLIHPSTGEITLFGSIDHELQPMYNLTVSASIQGQTTIQTTSLVSIIVGDFNDRKPHFIFPSADNFTTYTREGVEDGEFITQVHAEDADSGQNGRVSYYIKEGNGSHYFSIERDTGIIVAEEDMKQIGVIYMMTLVAYDNGSPKLTSEATLEIHIGGPGIGDTLSVTGTTQTIVIVIACICGFLAVVLIVAIAIIIRRQCCEKRRRHREVVVKFSADNPLCTASVTDDDIEKKGDSFSSRDSGNESGSGKEVDSGSSCSPGSSIEHESDVDECGSGQGSVEDNNRPLFLQVSHSFYRLISLLFLHLNRCHDVILDVM